MESLYSVLSWGFSEKRDFSSVHEGRPSRKHIGVEFDTPESHERMHGCRPRRALPKKGAAVAKLGGLHMMERRVEPTSRAGLGKHGKTSLLFLFFLSRPIFPFLNRAILSSRGTHCSGQGNA